jgi:hypothetical protein
MIKTIDDNEVINQVGIASLYNEQNLFQEKLKEGYNKIAFGRGSSISVGKSEEKITRMWAFYHPNGKIFTHQIPKSIDHPDPFPCRGPAFEREYLQDEFEQYIKDKKLTISEKVSLADILNKVN